MTRLAVVHYYFGWLSWDKLSPLHKLQEHPTYRCTCLNSTAFCVTTVILLHNYLTDGSEPPQEEDDVLRKTPSVQ